MKSRFLLLTLACGLAITTLACTSKPPATDTGNAMNSNDSSNPATANAPGNSGGGAMAGNNAASKAGATRAQLVVPSGTTLTVRLGETLSSKDSQPGQQFTASLVNPIEAEGKPVIPAGATATGTVVAAHAAGKFKGASLLEVKLSSITIGGKPYTIQTSAVEREQKGKGKRSAAMIGGGAGAGALIGALAGGGKGAAIGALVGGGAGTAGAAFTGKADITLPAESALSFKLTAPLEVKE
jgi:hypothetical protein